MPSKLAEPAVSTRASTARLRQIPWVAIAVFYSVALLVAAPFNTGYSNEWLRATFAETPLAIWPFLPAAFGPLLGALIAQRLYKRKTRQTTILGDGAKHNLLVALVPILAFSLIGGTGLALPCIALVYALGEEYGWRGFLADALAPLSPLGRYTITALLWWPWHLRFTTTFDWVGFPLIVFASAVVLGHAAQTSRSVLVSAAMHSTVILLTVSGPPTPALAVAGGITLASWILLGIVMPKPPMSAVTSGGARAA